MRKILLTTSLLTLGVFASACGASGSTSPPPSSATSAAAPAAPSEAAAPTTAASPDTAAAGSAATVATASTGKLGAILTDGHGATLYLFEKDTPNHSNCTGTCAGDWMPFTTSGAAPTAGPGTSAAMLATITRADGATQLTYNKHPLYYYSDDKKAPGSVEGQGNNEYGGLWYTVSPGGTADTAKK